MARADGIGPGPGSGGLSAPGGLAAAIGRLPTGAKLFLILSAALLPLAMIAVYAASQTNRLADQEVRSRLRVAATEASRALAIELNGDMNALRVALGALDDAPDDLASCARVQGVFAEQLAAGARFAIVGSDGRMRCGTAKLLPGTHRRPAPGQALAATIDPAHGLLLTLPSPSGKLSATALFPPTFLSRIARPSGFTTPFATDLVADGRRIELESLTGLTSLDRVESIIAPLDIDDLAMVMRVRSAPLTSPLVIAMLLPMLMWAAATGIAWFVVDRLLIRPLRQLRRTVAAYRPGDVIDPNIGHIVPAREIRELGDTFRTISRTVVEHEAGLAEGLLRQTKLTREVHHRVKNNLQVISSLINFHARGASSTEATGAYASIQRRVDALSVVHRNHYAELEENRGLSLRAVVNDLASNLRATLPEDVDAVSITLDIDGSYVNQDVATAVSFLITELIELAMTGNPAAPIRIAVGPGIADDRAALSVASPALVDNDTLRTVVATRYGRVLEGLARQLRSRLDHDAAEGAYRIEIGVTARE